MRRFMWRLGFVLLASLPHNLHAQILSDPDTGGGLTLTAEPILSAGPLPIRFAITLTNISNHDLRLPEPHLECGDVASGYIYLRVRFLPSTSRKLEPGRGCVVDSFRIPILKRLTHWKTLPSGQSLRYDMDLSNAEPNAPAPGTYTIWADYTPASVSPDELKLLQQSGVVVPTSPLATMPVEYHVRAH